jgi:hypothetical protein
MGLQPADLGSSAGDGRPLVHGLRRFVQRKMSEWLAKRRFTPGRSVERQMSGLAGSPAHSDLTQPLLIAMFAWLSFVDFQRAPADVLAIEFLNGRGALFLG